LQIGKNQEESSRDVNHSHQSNIISSIDNISTFAETPEGMQPLIDVVQEFTTWYSMQIYVMKVQENFLARYRQGSEVKGKHDGTRSENRWQTSQNATFQ